MTLVPFAELDVATVAEIGTAVGTLFLGAATLAAVRSANRAARVAERSLLLGLRPVLVTPRSDEPEVKILFGDRRKFSVHSGAALAKEIDGVVYLAIPLRNVGAGLAVMQSYDVQPGYELQRPHESRGGRRRDRVDRRHRPIETFRPQLRDIYIAPGDSGYWHAALRDGDDEILPDVSRAIAAQDAGISIDLLYGDHEGGQHSVSRFVMIPAGEDRWLCSVVYHWTIEGPDPRELPGA
jgi:hypothetical protein